MGLSLAGLDVYVSVAGGVRVAEPGADLGVALAIASALTGHALPSDLVACGEVGLGGELRQVAQTPRRLAEARVGSGSISSSCPSPRPTSLASRTVRRADARRRRSTSSASASARNPWRAPW